MARWICNMEYGNTNVEVVLRGSQTELGKFLGDIGFPSTSCRQASERDMRTINVHLKDRRGKVKVTGDSSHHLDYFIRNYIPEDAVDNIEWV